MNRFLILLAYLFGMHVSYGQNLIPGAYDPGLRLAYDSKTNKVTGYFEAHGGWDEQKKASTFSCIFYLEGVLKGNTVRISSYYPGSISKDTISGEINIMGEGVVTIRLASDHGGCWNVQPFAKDAVQFELEEKADWVQVRYVKASQAYFYAEPSGDKQRKAYLVRNDIVCIDGIKDGWAHCTYFGKVKTSGWVKLSDLN